MILLGLGVLWAAVLLPPMLKNRSVASGPMGPSSFAPGPANRLDVYHVRSIPKPTYSPPRSSAAARRRRRDVILILLGFSIFTFFVGLAVGGVFLWTMHFIADLVLVGYSALLTQRKQVGADKTSVVIPMHSTVDHPGLNTTTSEDVEEEYLIGRIAN